MSDLADLLLRLVHRIAEVERKQANMVRQGTVHEVDPAKQRVRLKLGEGKNGKPFLSAWRPYAQLAGGLKVHTPPTVGQQMTLISGSGDIAQGLAVPMTWSNQNASPSDKGDENVLTYGPFKATLKANDLLLEMGGAKLRMRGNAINLALGGSEIIVTNGAINIKSSLVLVEGSQLFHNIKNIGDTHTNSGLPVD